jgi:type I restriction enzyme S subunit
MKFQQVSLDELIALERRPVKVEPDQQYSEIGVYCFGRGIFHKSPRSGMEVGDKPLFQIKEGDFILQVTFAWEGAVALASSAEDGMYGSTRFLTFRVDEKRCIAKYLIYYFRTPAGLEQLIKISPGSAGRNRVLSVKRIPEVIVPLPSIEDQQRIVRKIDELAAKIKDVCVLRQQTTEETKALFKSEIKHRILSLANKFGTKYIRDVAKCANGFGFPKQYQGRTGLKYPFVKVSDMNLSGNEYKITTAQNWIEENDIKLLRVNIYPEGTIIFPKVGGAIATNKRRILGLPATFDNNVMGLIPSRNLLSEYLFFFMTSFDLTMLQAGTSVPAINQSKVEILEIPVPSLPEQHRIAKEFESFQTKVNKLKVFQIETSAEFNALLPSILDKAFKGEL